MVNTQYALLLDSPVFYIFAKFAFSYSFKILFMEPFDSKLQISWYFTYTYLSILKTFNMDVILYFVFPQLPFTCVFFPHQRFSQGMCTLVFSWHLFCCFNLKWFCHFWTGEGDSDTFQLNRPVAFTVSHYLNLFDCFHRFGLDTSGRSALYVRLRLPRPISSGGVSSICLPVDDKFD